MMEWQIADVTTLAEELVQTGLGTMIEYGHITLNSALCPYLHQRLDPEEQAALTECWRQAMQAYVAFLVQQRSEKIELAATLTLLELPNLFALLEQIQTAGDPAVTIELATPLYSLLQTLGKPRLLDYVGQVRDAAAALGADWNHAAFQAQRTRIEQQLAGGQLQETLADAQKLLQRARAAGVEVYAEADYDLAMAYDLLAQVLGKTGSPDAALPLLDEAQAAFEAIARERGSKAAESMASVCLAERGDCFLLLGRLDEAASVYKEAIERDEKRGDERDVAVGKFQLGTVSLGQGRYGEALEAYEAAREQFDRLGEPASVATAWHRIGIVHQRAGQAESAETAYQHSLAISVRLGDPAGQAVTLNQLAHLYADSLDRPEEAVTLFLVSVVLGYGAFDTVCILRGQAARLTQPTLNVESARAGSPRRLGKAVGCW